MIYGVSVSAIVVKECLPHAKERFPDGIIQFRQDNHCAYNAESVKNWFARCHDIEVMEWSARLPDLNPIESVWLQLSGTFA